MNIILDTHTLIWFFESDTQLSKTARTMIESTENQSFLSVASVWEMVIKQGIGKLNLNKSVDQIISHIVRDGVELIDITADHTLKTGELVMHHKDPFDRLIISQSLYLDYPVIGKDEIFDMYSVKRIW